MPEFIMPTQGTVGQPPVAWGDLDAFTQGYISGAFFTECHADNPELEDAEFSDLDPATLAAIIEDCADWQAANRAALDEASAVREGYDDERAGTDYWLTRNGHGAGFWDRGLGDVGDRLSAACRYSSVDVYRGDDGKVYFS
jgi:hypothetical protein